MTRERRYQEISKEIKRAIPSTNHVVSKEEKERLKQLSSRLWILKSKFPNR